jgi:hypothetical protein
MAKTPSPYQLRKAALDRLKRAQKLITEGRKELTAAQAKIDSAQVIMNESADLLRKTWPNQQN